MIPLSASRFPLLRRARIPAFHPAFPCEWCVATLAHRASQAASAMTVWGTLRKAACFRRFSRYYIRWNNSAEMPAPWERFCMDSRCAIEEVAASQRGETLVEQLARLWERSVRATHLFLSEDDIVAMRPEVREGLRAVPQLAVAFGDGAPLGFAGVADGKLEMLLIRKPETLPDLHHLILALKNNDFSDKHIDFASASTFRLHAAAGFDGASIASTSTSRIPPHAGSTSTRASAWRRARNSTRREGRSPSCIWNAAQGSAYGAGLRVCERASRHPTGLRVRDQV